MRFLFFLCASMLAALLLSGFLLQTSAFRRGLAPPPFPSALLLNADVPSIWIAVRAGCPHCHAHLEALMTAADRLAPEVRDATLKRVYLCGAPAHDGTVPKYMRHASPLETRRVPTTWILSAERTVSETWVGARNVVAWSRVLGTVAEAGDRAR